MEWATFKGWLGALRRRREGAEVSPESWRNADQDPWWVEQRRLRDQKRREGF